jgi:cyclophilin family peptidyl-prolyl cis-trans isomerase
MSDNYSKMFLLLVFLVLSFSCNSKPTENSADSGNVSEANVTRNVKPAPDEQVAVVESADYGTIVLELYPNLAPQMVAQFKRLIQEGFYNGTSIHRISADAGLLQGGDPLSKDDDPRNDGTGSSSYPDVPAEFSDIPFDRGTLGAARRGATPAFGGRAGLTEEQARGTSNSQFFITLKRQPQFDEEYILFGSVIEGISNADVIAGAPVVAGTERPAQKIIIKSITLQPRSKYVSK